MILRQPFHLARGFISLFIYSCLLSVWQLSAQPNRVGDYQSLIYQLEQQLKQAKTKPERALLYSQLGDAHFANQELIEAGQHFAKALRLARQLDNSHILSHVLNNKGNLHSVHLEDEQALQAYGEALALAIQNQDVLAQVQILGNRLRLQLRRENKQAIPNLWQHLSRIIQQLPAEKQPYYQINWAYLGLEIYHFSPDLLALSDLSPTLEQLAEQGGDKRSRSQAYGLLGQIQLEEKNYAEAEKSSQQAAFFAQEQLDLLYYWQWQHAGILKAQGHYKAAESSYRRALANLQPVRQQMTQGRRDALDIFIERIRPVYFDLAALLLEQAKTTLIDRKQQLLLRRARNTIELLKIAELEDYFQDQCVAEAKARRPDDLVLEKDTAVLYPIMLKDRTILLLQTHTGIEQIELDVSYHDLNQTALGFHYNLQNSASNRFINEAKQLYQWLITPIKPSLVKADIKTLLLVPDGALRLIPLAALYNPDAHQFLISEYAVAITPSLQLTDIRPLSRPNLKILVNGLSQSVQEFTELPNVPAEVDSIGSLFNNSQVLMNQDFSLDRFSEHLQQNPYEIVHVASHGQFNRDPRKTFLLTHDDKLTMNKLEQLLNMSKQQDRAIELLTLSACQTAVGDDRAALGLAGVAIKAGARSALASLWFVNDAATSELVVRFYQKIQKQGLSKAEALRAAQQELLAQRMFRHPAYWAAFILIGNWL